jgi:hypothetical protein
MNSVARVGSMPCRQPVDEHFPDALRDLLGGVEMRGQRVPVGCEEQALVLLLQANPVLERPV